MKVGQMKEEQLFRGDLFFGDDNELFENFRIADSHIGENFAINGDLSLQKTVRTTAVA